MVFSYNPNDPMCHSVYMESPVPTIEEIVNGQTPNPLQYATPINPNGPRLAPQPTKDGYYKSDGVDDGKISTFEKLKAFVKGGTYNMVRGIFCDKDGFSIGRTLASTAGITAIALTGPVGLAVASGLGLICAVDNFNNSRHKAKYATTDQQAREAYEGFGESATTAGLSLWGGYKGLKGIKAKFFKSKAPTPQPNPPTNPQGNPPVATQPNPPTNPQGNPPVVPQPNPPANPQGNPPAIVQPRNANIGEINAEGFFNEWAPTGDIPVKSPNPAPQIQTHEYIPDWKPTGDIPKPTSHPYVNEWAPTGNTPKATNHPYFNEYTPTGEIPKTTAIQSTPNTEIITNNTTTGIPAKPQLPNVDANHFFG